jgi:hypothetical protein
LLEETIKKKLENLSNSDFRSAKRKTFDTISHTRLDLSKTSYRHFAPIYENTYKFYNFEIVDKYSRSLLKSDIIKFFKENFLDTDALKFTLYVIKYIFNLDVFEENR